MKKKSCFLKGFINYFIENSENSKMKSKFFGMAERFKDKKSKDKVVNIGPGTF